MSCNDCCNCTCEPDPEVMTPIGYFDQVFSWPEVVQVPWNPDLAVLGLCEINLGLLQTYLDTEISTSVPGSLAKFTDNVGRRYVALKTNYGWLVSFVHYDDSDEIYAQYPTALSDLMGWGNEGICDVNRLDATYTPTKGNLGQRLAAVLA